MSEKNLKANEKYLLRIKEAADYFGLGEKKMRRLAEDGQNIYSVLFDNRWMINRKKFRQYLEKYYFSGKKVADEDIPIKVF